MDTDDSQLVAYRIQNAPGDEWADIVVAFNGSDQAKRVALPEGNWQLMVNGREVDPDGIGGSQKEWTYLTGGATAILVKR
jgi:pullulanase